MKYVFTRILVCITLLALTFGAIGVTPAYAATFLVTVTTDSNDGVCDSNCSLREAIAASDALAGADTITFAPGISGGIIYLGSKLILSQSVTIDGSALASKITISGDTDNNNTADVQVFKAADGISVTLDSLIVTKGIADFGGGIYSFGGTLTVINCMFTDNYATGVNHFGYGGGIYAQSSGLTVTNSLFSGNVSAIDGGAIYISPGSVTITSSNFSNNATMDGSGGGIFIGLATPATLTHSTFVNNAANRSVSGGAAGAIFNDGVLTVDKSTISSNSAQYSGGGITNWGTLTVVNSTLSNNSALVQGGGIENFLGGTLTLINSTLSGNAAASGGGIHNPSPPSYNPAINTFNYINSIIANSPTGGDCFNTGVLATNTRNLVEDGSCAAALSGDPNLDVLAANGGVTQSFALLTGSNAIDAGDDVACTNAPVANSSQNGVTRPQGAHCDIGSYEAPSIATPTISAAVPETQTSTVTATAETGTTTPTVTSTTTVDATETQTATITSTVAHTSTIAATSTPTATRTRTATATPTRTAVCVPAIIATSSANSGAGTLRQALADICSGGTITFAAGLSGQIITVASPLTISKSVTINGAGLAPKITISGDNRVQVFKVNSGVNVVMNRLVLTKGFAMGVGNNILEGGAIYSAGTLTITDTTIFNNAAGEGGGIYNDGGTLNIVTSMLSGNMGGNGGAIANIRGMLTITNSTITGNGKVTGNATLYGGGGIYNDKGTLKMTGSTLSGNFSPNGGGLFNWGSATIINSTLTGNFAPGGLNETGNGGAINNNNYAELVIISSTISDNSADIGGGMVNFGPATITNSTFSGNSNGAIDNGSTLTITNSTFTGNSAMGGAVSGSTIHSSGVLNYANTIFADSVLGPNCHIGGGGTIGTNLNNLVEDGSCSAALSGNPKLGPLASNGGTTKTHALLAGSKAINAGSDAICAVAPVSNTSQNGVTRPQGTHCDIGAYEYVPPALTVTINQAVGQADPVSMGPIHFTAVFSEGVTGFTGSDLSFGGATVKGTLAATVTQIAPMNGTRYDVAITGMIPLGLVTVSIPAGKANSIARPAVTNQASTSTDNRVTFDYILAEFGSSPAKDGWLLESTETSGVGGGMNNASIAISVGDDASDRQYRGLLDFATGSLPDNAVIGVINLRIIQANVTGTNPFTTHGPLKSEIKSGFFGSAAALQTQDFAFAPDKPACDFQAVPEILESLGTAYRCVVLASAFPSISLTGTTQFRLRFTLDDNDDMGADTFNFYSGDFSSWSQRPRLFIKYYIPPAP